MKAETIRRFAEWWAAHVPGAHKTTLYTKRKRAPGFIGPDFGLKELYLERYYITPRWLSELPFGVGIFLHRFHAPDQEGLHDHPWDFATFVLSGGYGEETFHTVNHRHAGSWLTRFGFRGASMFHRIAWLHPETWTLMIHGPRRKPWGFLRPEAVDGYEVWKQR